MKYQILFLAFVSASLGFANPARAQVLPQLKVLTLNYNSEDVMNDTDETIRDLRFHALSGWIQAHSPDVILLQEAWNYHGDPSVSLTLARNLGYDVAYRLDMGLPGLFYDSDAVLTKKDLRMTSENDLKLPHSAIEKGDGKTWIIELGSVSYAVGVQTLLSNGDHLFLYSTHLLGGAESDRQDQLLAIDQDVHKKMTAQNLSWEHTHVIIGGDLNSEPSELGPSSLEKRNYIDSFNEAHPNDASCTYCGDVTVPYFNPITLGAGLFPSQSSETNSARYDYLFYQSKKLKTLSSSLVFTLPWEGVWMSDHYGVFTVFGDPASSPLANPSHDNDETALPVVFSVTDSLMLCDSSWQICKKSLPSQQILGARGLVIQNRSSVNISISVNGPGMIMTDSQTQLAPGNSVAFSFAQKGNFTYQIDTASEDTVRRHLSGKIQVITSGY